MTFTLDPQVNHEELAEEPSSPSTPSTPSVAEVSDTSNSLTTAEAPVENSLSPELESTEGKGPYSRIKLNHPPEVIIGNMNDLTLRKCTIDKCVANFISYSCYLSQVEPTKVEESL